ncbi:MAG: EAL domain-containing protein [Gammaproteobacteria bacterium]|nr:EAL domain-containing protein [Gammaproteobacteria bacterium]
MPAQPQSPVRQLVLAMLVTAVALLPQLTGWQALDRFFYDRLIRQQAAPPADDILLITIDQRSLDRLGRWPWRRTRHAELIEILGQAKPRAVALDILFAEPDLERPEDDRRLAAAIRAQGRTLLPLIAERASVDGALRETQPLALLAEAAAGLGHADAEIDNDGLVRSAYLKAGLGEASWPALALALATLGDPQREPDFLVGERNYGGMTGSGWVRDYRVLIPYSGPPGSIAGVSYVDVLEGRIPADRLSGKYLLVGATASGIGETLATPVATLGEAMSGVEFNAQLLDSILRQRLIVGLEWPLQAGLSLLIALGGIILSITLPGRALLPALLLTTIALLALCYALFTQAQLWYPPAGALLALLLGFALFARQRLLGMLRALFAARDNTDLLLASIGEAIINTDAEGRILQLNNAAAQLTGFKPDEVRGRPLRETFNLQLRDGRAFEMRQLLAGKLFHSSEPLLLSTLRGRKAPVQVAATPLPQGDMDAYGALIVITDISEEERLQAAIAHRERHDPLTQLPNREHLLHKLKPALRRATASGHTLILVKLAISRLHTLDQQLGENDSEQLLRTIAQRLERAAGPGGIAARTGSDEFALVIESSRSADDTAPVVERLQQDLGAELEISGKSVRPQLKLGVSCFPDLAATAEELLRQAGSALYQSKSQQDSSYTLFSEDMRSEIEHRRRIELAFERALRDELLESFYLPLIRAGDRVICGVEGLLRLPDGEGGHLPAHEFIAQAEQAGLMAEIGYRQFSEICYQHLLWREQGLPALRLAFNLSRSQLQDPALPAALEHLMRSNNVDPELVEFEIGEPIIRAQGSDCLKVVRDLRKLGCSICLDDFGTSSGAMSSLMAFDFQRLKIDPLFVQNIGTQAGSGALTSAMIGMAHSLNMQVTAEGVENNAQFDLLRRQGCDEMQGFYFGEPLPAADLAQHFLDSGGVAVISKATDGRE